MKEIICDCGHSKWYHLNRCGAMGCSCGLSKEAVDARYWAREYKAKYDEFVAKWNDTHTDVYDALNDARKLTDAYKNLANYWKERYHAMRKDFDEMLGSIYEPKA